LLGLRSIGLALLRTVDAIETNAFSMAIVEDFDGVTVENSHDLAVELFSERIGK